MNSVRCPLALKEGSKKQNSRFPYVFPATKFLLLCENCQRQSCKAFTGLSKHGNMVD